MVTIKQEVLDILRSDERKIVNIAAGIKPGFRTVERWTRENKPDGPLTTLTVLDIIKQETGLQVDQIIERKTVVKEAVPTLETA